jgi:hypothetical protein
MIMPNVFRPLNVAALSFAMFMATGSVTARAQGSAGGSIGNDDKSVSGSRSEPRSVEPEGSSRQGKPNSEKPERGSQKGGGGGSNFDGTWSYVGVGTNCQGTGSGVFTVSGGRVALAGGRGSVTPNGAIRSTAVGNDGVTVNATGKLLGNLGGGTYMRTDGCGGRWSATRQ